MSRALKLFCSIGPLFLLIAIISFLWPTYIIKKDLHTVETLFTSETLKEQISLASSRAALFKLKMEQAVSLIKSSLLYVQESSTLQESFEGAIQSGEAWKKAGKTLSYNNGIGLLEITENGKPILAIAPENAFLYASKMIPINDNVVYTLVDNYQGILEPFIGIRLAITADNDPLDAYFLYPIAYLFPGMSSKDPELLKKLKSFSKTITEDIRTEKILSLKELIAYLAKTHTRKSVETATTVTDSKVSPKELLEFYDNENAFFINIRTRQFIHALLEGIEESPFDNGAPYGIVSASLNQDGVFNAVAMLASDLFFDKNLIPSHIDSSGFIVIDNPLLKQIFIGASTDIKTTTDTYRLTLASSISPILSDLVTNMEAIAIISDAGKPYVAVNPAGLMMPHAAIANISLQTIHDKSYGIIEFLGNRYQFMQLKPFDNSQMTIVILRPEALDPIHSLHTTILSELNATSETLAVQLLGINLGILLIALTILLFLSRAVTKPVRLLAKATEELAKGNYGEVNLPSFSPGSKDEIAILSNGFERMVIALRDKEKMRGVLNKVVSKEIAAEILKGTISLGGESRVVTVMFADIRNFTHMSEKIEPERLLIFLNKFMTKMSVIIEEHYGVIDKYIGDEVMALYGAPHLDPDGAKKAIETALLMIAELKKWNIERAAEGFPEIAIGIGINTGKMVVGNMGAENRLNYTVLGANVNLGARLCSRAEPMQILISEQTLEASGLKDRLLTQEIDSLELKGFSSPVKAFSVLGFKE